MIFYLSSYKFGNKTEILKNMIPANKSIGHINNARDFVGTDPKRATKNQQEEISFLNQLGFQAEVLDLQEYFGNSDALKNKLNNLGGVWISGGNTFVLRQAMKLSGFDTIFQELTIKDDFLYGGYSAGICILSTSLKPIDQVDDAYNFPYEELKTTIWTGLGVFDYSFMPHFDSDHHESKLIDKEIERCIENKWLFKALRDGDVIIKN